MAELCAVFAVAQLVKSKLEAVGYRVILTKTSATQRVSLGQRAAIANAAHASLAVSITTRAARTVASDSTGAITSFTTSLSRK
ncbi:MAG: N-acetylmuramoyl-L-alanine amidase, partial [Pseudonocardiales bacterium]|nr:N-acetylmuramoyl-L-alanine amidase [Pseudonocardiales bacterium]